MNNTLLKSYFPIADCIAGMFGSDCEVVVHDLTHPESSVVYVANGSVTGRQIGQSFDHLVRQVLLNKNFKNDCLCNYMFETPGGEKIKSSSVLIRDEQHNVIGMICINYKVSLYYQLQQHVNKFLSTSFIHEEEQEVADDVMLIIDELIAKIIGDQDAKNLTRKKCVELISFMDKKGIFLVKGAIDKVATIMGVSKVTIYSYLDEAKGKRN